jgi:hypothetical protein
MRIEAYYQGTADPNEKRKSDKLPAARIDLDVRSPNTFTHYRNFDYTSDPDPNETGIGGGLYHGPMDRFKSVKEFLDRRRKKMKARQKKASGRMELLLKFTREI